MTGPDFKKYYPPSETFCSSLPCKRISREKSDGPATFLRTASLKISPLLHNDRSHEKVSFPSDPGSGHLLHGNGLRILHAGRTTNGAESRFENGRMGLFGTQVFEAGYPETTLTGAQGCHPELVPARRQTNFPNSLNREFFHFRPVGNFTAFSTSLLTTGSYADFPLQFSYLPFLPDGIFAGFVFSPIHSGQIHTRTRHPFPGRKFQQLESQRYSLPFPKKRRRTMAVADPIFSH